MARIVMFAYLDPSIDTRVRREARALADAGYRVAVVGLHRGKAADMTWRTVDGIRMLSVASQGRWQDVAADVRYPWRTRGRTISAVKSALGRGRRGLRDLGTAFAWGTLAAGWSTVRLPIYLASGRRPRGTTNSTLDWLLRWRITILGWADAAARAAPAADVWHAHDLPGLAAATQARRQFGGLLVYDVRDLFSEAGSTALQPSWVRRLLRWMERRWAADASAIVTVNEGLARTLAVIVGPVRSVIVGNCPPRWTPPARPRDLLREACAISPSAPVILYHGRFGPNRGLGNVAAALQRPELRAAHLVFMGSGPLRADLEVMVEDPGYGGRIHVLDPVAPEELIEWISAADVGVATNVPVCLNERLSTPNKLFECLAAGVPVVSSDFPIRRQILLSDPGGPLGEICDPCDPADIAAAIARVLAMVPEERLALHIRCSEAARERWNWETESARLVALYASLLGGPGGDEAHMSARKAAA